MDAAVLVANEICISRANADCGSEAVLGDVGITDSSFGSDFECGEEDEKGDGDLPCSKR